MFRECGECTACCTWLIGDSFGWKFGQGQSCKFLESNFRLDREFWIGTGNGKMKSLYQSKDYEPYQYFYQEKDYVS